MSDECLFSVSPVPAMERVAMNGKEKESERDWWLHLDHRWGHIVNLVHGKAYGEKVLYKAEGISCYCYYYLYYNTKVMIPEERK